MAKIAKVGDLEIPSDNALQEGTWRVQRVAWWVMAGILLTAVLGLFGGGPFGTGTAGRTDGPRVEYPRGCRLRSSTTLDVFSPTNPEGESRIWVSLAFLDRAEIVRVDPEPTRVESAPDGLTYITAAKSGGELARVRFYLDPNRPGPLRGRIRPGDGSTLDFTSIVYP